MKICIISKYPPIEGGVSSWIYWFSKALGELNHKVYIVTNCMEVEEGYREEISKDDTFLFEPKNVKVYSTGPVRRFIPFHNPYGSKLVNLAIQVIRKHDIGLIYSEYLLPYGVAGLMTKHITKKPFMAGHAGSDITRLFDEAHLKTLFIEIFKGADLIATSSRHRDKILKRCQVNLDNFIISLPKAVNLREFHPGVKPFDISSYLKKNKKEKLPTLLYLGKISKLKKTFEFVDAASSIKKEAFRIIFIVGSVSGAIDLKKYVQSKGLAEKTIFLPFQPPWVIPSLMNLATCVVSPESSEEPFLPKNTHYPKIAREAMACGKSVIIGKGMTEKGIYRRLQDGVNIYIVNPDDKKEFAGKLKMIVRNPDIALKVGIEARKFSEATEDFDGCIQQWVKAFKALLLTHSVKMRDNI